MNRRAFIKSMLTALLPAAISPNVLESEIARVLEDTRYLNNNNFIAYMVNQMNLYCDNPRMSAVITGISE